MTRSGVPRPPQAEAQLNPVALARAIIRDRRHAQLFEGWVQLLVRQVAKTPDDVAGQCAQSRAIPTVDLMGNPSCPPMVR
jgi:hypothetical protein